MKLKEKKLKIALFYPWIKSRGGAEKVLLEIMKIKDFDFSQNAEIVSINFDKPILEVIEDIKKKLSDKFSGMEVSLSLASGEGKEHMSLVSALLNLPVGVKFVALTKDGIAEF